MNQSFNLKIKELKEQIVLANNFISFNEKLIEEYRSTHKKAFSKNRLPKKIKQLIDSNTFAREDVKEKEAIIETLEYLSTNYNLSNEAIAGIGGSNLIMLERKEF